MKPCRTIGCLLLASLLSLSARAGGPGRLGNEGEPLRWDTSQPIRYVIDQGNLGSRTQAAAATLVAAAAKTWENVPDATLRFAAVGVLSQDVTGRNVAAFLNGLRPTQPCPILFDSDGSITEALLGEGADLSGFSSIGFRNSRQATIQLSYVVLNGATLDEYSDAYAQAVAVHEIGHAIGLDHSQINEEQEFDGDPGNDHIAPVMSYGRGPNDQGGLHQDDVAWCCWLYPGSGFMAKTGAIRGRVLLPDRVTGLRGVNVIARRVGDPLVTAVSCVSGYRSRSEGEGPHDPAHLGEYLIPGLPPGSYTLEIGELQEEPAMRVPITLLPGGAKQWREGSGPQDPPGSSTPIVVNAGQEVSGIDVIVNAEDLGEPRAVAEQEPNELPRGQSVTLPAVVTGVVEDIDGTTAGPVIEDEQDLPMALQDTYRVIVREPTVLTAILTAQIRGADLDLYVVRQEDADLAIVASANESGTPPETIQVSLPAGRYFIGVRRASERGSAYTLRLLATPAPESTTETRPVWLNYLLVGDVTASGATARWQTTGEATSVVFFGPPRQEVGSTQRTREHIVPLMGLTPETTVTIDVFVSWGDSFEGTQTRVTTAAPSSANAPNGSPRVVVNHTARELDPGFAEAQIRFTNRGEADALNLRIEQVTPAAGWRVLSQYVAGEPLPDVLELGSIGPGGAGVFLVRLLRTGGTAAPSVKVGGSYTDGTGATYRF